MNDDEVVPSAVRRGGVKQKMAHLSAPHGQNVFGLDSRREERIDVIDIVSDEQR